MVVKDIDEFNRIVAEVENGKDYQQPLAFGIGIATVSSDNSLLDSYFPSPNFKTNFKSAAILAKVLGYKNGTHSYKVSKEQLSEILSYFTPFENDGKRHENIIVLKNLQKRVETLESNRKVLVVSFIGSVENDSGPKEVPDAYLRLHLLSHRLVKPQGINLTNIVNILPNVVWTSEGPIALNDLSTRRIDALTSGRTLTVHSVDKFPRMVDYVVPSGVCIADVSRVRLGAYLGEGATILYEGFVNFNESCQASNMVGGPIPATANAAANASSSAMASQTMGALSDRKMVFDVSGSRDPTAANPPFVPMAKAAIAPTQTSSVLAVSVEKDPSIEGQPKPGPVATRSAIDASAVVATATAVASATPPVKAHN